MNKINFFVFWCSSVLLLHECTGRLHREGLTLMNMLDNILTNEDLEYVRLDKNGYINKGLMNSHKSESGNFNALSSLVNSEFDVHVSLGTSYTYKDGEGNIKQSTTMSYSGPDAVFMDTGFEQVGGTTTEESGFMGKTLLSGKGASGENSIDDSRIDIIVNSNLSETGRAEIYSHEANGHAVIYVNTRDRRQSAHQAPNWVEMNKPLANKILNSRRETVTNMRSR